MKRLLSLAFAIVVIVVLLCCGSLAEGENLLANGGFETLDDTGAPVGWYTSAYRTQEGYTRFSVSSDVAQIKTIGPQ